MRSDDLDIMEKADQALVEEVKKMNGTKTFKTDDETSELVGY